MIFLDTHIVVWLYSGYKDRFGEISKKFIEENQLFISPIVLLELQYLYEIGRISLGSKQIFDDLSLRIGLKIDQTEWLKIIEKTLAISWTRDPFDRHIVAHAQVAGGRLLTADNLILKNCLEAVWD